MEMYPPLTPDMLDLDLLEHIEEARYLGRLEGCCETARALKEMNSPIDVIMKITKLPAEVIEDL
jgi:hypothetical protein